MGEKIRREKAIERLRCLSLGDGGGDDNSDRDHEDDGDEDT